MKQTLQNTLLALAGMFLVIALGYALMSGPFFAKAEDATTLPATIATSSLIAVGPQEVTTIIATTSCTARIITTYANPVMLTFSDVLGQSPSGTFGHLQPASTTVVYDAGEYGCGKVKAYGYTATTSITFTSAR